MTNKASVQGEDLETKINRIISETINSYDENNQAKFKGISDILNGTDLKKILASKFDEMKNKVDTMIDINGKEIMQLSGNVKSKFAAVDNALTNSLLTSFKDYDPLKSLNNVQGKRVVTDSSVLAQQISATNRKFTQVFNKMQYTPEPPPDIFPPWDPPVVELSEEEINKNAQE